MILSDKDIRQEIASGGLGVEHMIEGAIGPCSIDLMLSNYFHVFNEYREDPIDLREDQSHVGHSVVMKNEAPFLLGPRQFVLSSTREQFTFPSHLAGQLEGKSSLARLGLLVHVTAGFFDAGFCGYPTLELVNVRTRPILLYPGMPVAQMAIFALTSEVDVPYWNRGQAKYRDQGAKPATSQFHRNFE